VPALAVVALLVYWAAHGGGYAPTTWEPSALVVLGLLAATVFGLGFARIRLTRASAIGLAALGLYVAWSYLSIAWAAAPGDALDGSNRTLLYGLLFALFAVLPWRSWTAGVTLTAFALGIGAVALVTLVRVGSSGDVAGMFSDGRLVAPTDYVNATAAMFMVGSVVAIALGARGELPVALRAALLALATVSLQAAVLCESRGWLFTLPIVLVAALAIMRDRLRFALWALLPIAGALASLPALLDVFRRVDAATSSGTPAQVRTELIDAGSHAVGIALPCAGVVLVVALLLALLDRRARISDRLIRNANRAACGIAIVAAVAGVGVGLVATHGRPDRSIARYWDRSNGYKYGASGGSRFALVGSDRPDFWRLSLRAFADHPVGGLGQDNWATYYLRDRRSGDQPRWTHSLELRLLAHTGLVGFALFATFLAGAGLQALRGRRRRDRLPVALAGTALLPVVVWLVHGSIDWLWEFPVLSGAALAFAALAGSLMNESAPPPAADPPERAESASRGADATAPRPSPRRLPALVFTGLAVVGLVAAAVAIAFPYLADRQTNAATNEWRSDPAAAFTALDRAAELNPLSSRPGVTGGVIALELHRPAAAAARFDQAVARDPDNWFAYFGRGLAASAARDPAAARAAFARARVLDPGEPLVRAGLARVDSKRPLSSDEAFGMIRRDVARLTGGA
jgi:hypothetical protein